LLITAHGAVLPPSLATEETAAVLKGRDVLMIHDLHRQGLSIQEIARRTGHDRKTVRKYLKAGLEPPVYGPRDPRPSILGPYKAYIGGRLSATPGLTASRLLREIRELGYAGGATTVKDFVREIRPAPPTVFERRFETAPGQQAQVDFAHFRLWFTDEPSRSRVIWLFSMVLGFSRHLFARFVPGQGLDEVVRGHLAAFDDFGGVPKQILYDRMKTAVIGEDADGRVIFNATLVDLACHHGFTPKACKPYRAKTKGKVERPFRYIRQDFFEGRSFRNLDDLNRQLQDWLDHVANRRVHGTTGRVVAEAFAEEKQALLALPAIPFRSVLKLERRITKDGMVSIGGNLYSVPDGTRRRPVEVQVLAKEVRILEAGRRIAVHPVLIGRGRRSLLPGHRSAPRTHSPHGLGNEGPLLRPGEAVLQRPLEHYEQVGRALAQLHGGRIS
jgi:transposase